MADTIKVRLLRAYLWDDEKGNLVSYGPGEVEIPRAMAEGLQREKVDIGVDLPKMADSSAQLPDGVAGANKEGDVHPKIFAQRESDASARSVKAAVALAKRFGLDESEAALKAEHEQPDNQQVQRNEAVAETLEALLKVTPTDVGDFARQAEEAVAQRLKEAAKHGRDALLAAINDLPGIGPKTIEAIANVIPPDPVPNDMPPAETTDTAQDGATPNADGVFPDATS